MHKKSFALAAAISLACTLSTHAQEKVWKHGILEAKSDAGFIAMVDKGGFAAKRGCLTRPATLQWRSTPLSR